MINTIIIENSKQDVAKLEMLLALHCPEIKVMEVCSTVVKGINAIKQLKPQLVFLDVQLEPGSGFDVLQQTEGLPFETIFTTSYNEYAVKAFKFCALDYLLKPISTDELKAAVNNYKKLAENGTKKNIDALLHNYRQIDKTLQIAGIPVISGIDFITVSEIICCKASSNYTELYTINGGKITATKTLKWIEDLLSEHVFFRVHDSYLINLNHIKKYLKGGEGGFVILTGEKEIAVSRRKKDEFLKVLAGLKIISSK